MADQHQDPDFALNLVRVLSEEEESGDALKKRNQELRGLLNKVINILKEKTNVCLNLEKQNSALNVQVQSLKDIVAITKNLLGIRNTEVENMQKDLTSLQENINTEKERHNKMIEKISNANKINEDVKGEYQNQMDLFKELRERYNEKVTLLEKENENLKAELKNLKEEADKQNKLT